MADRYSTRAQSTAIGVYNAVGTFQDVATYTVATATPANQNDIIYMIRIPGASAPGGIRLTGLRLDFDDLGTGVTLDVGDYTTAATPVVIDADKYMDGVDVSTNAGFAQMGANITASPYPPLGNLYTTDAFLGVLVLGGNISTSGSLTFRLTATMEAQVP